MLGMFGCAIDFATQEPDSTDFFEWGYDPNGISFLGQLDRPTLVRSRAFTISGDRPEPSGIIRLGGGSKEK